jgi:hypothetical protein
VLIRCDAPHRIASRLFELDHVVEVRIVDSDQALLVRTRDADDLYRRLNRIILDTEVTVEAIIPADETVHAVYDYLIGDTGQAR